MLNASTSNVPLIDLPLIVDSRITNAAVIGLLLVIFGAIVASLRGKGTINADDIPTLPGTLIFGHWRFFSHRYDFINEGLKMLGSTFQFKVLNHKVIAVSGEKARVAFVNSSALNFREGYKVLFGAAPTVVDVNLEVKNMNSSESAWFAKRVLSILRRDRLEKILPRIFNDLEMRMKNWGDSGRFESLDEIYMIVFQLTVRAGACKEIADNPIQVARLREFLQDSEKSATATSVLLKWLPSKDRRRQKESSRNMYLMIKKVLDERRASGRREDDPTQVLIDEGVSENDIIEFTILTLFAGVANTGIMSAWLVMYLGINAEWKEKVLDEVRSFIAKYAPERSATSDVIGNLAVQLSKVPPTVWEEEMAVTDLCLRETIRVAQSSVFLRRNVVKEDVDIGGVKIGFGDFVAYPSSDVHHNPAVYDEPSRFDPSRHLAKDGEKQPPFVGWGAGRHPCLGMRFAKLEVKWIVAMFLTAYDYQVVNEKDEVLRELPEPDHNNIFDRTRRPAGGPLYLKYQRKDSLAN